MLFKVVRHCWMKKMVTYCQSYLVISMMAESAMLIRKLVKDTFQQMKVEVEKYKYKQLIQQTNTTMQSEIPPPLWQQHPCLPPPLEAWQWSMSMSYVICIVGCPNQKIIANRKNLMYTSICEHQLWVSVPGQLKQHVPQTVHCLPQDASLEIGGKICFPTIIWIPWRFLKPP